MLNIEVHSPLGSFSSDIAILPISPSACLNIPDQLDMIQSAIVRELIAYNTEILGTVYGSGG